MQRILVIGSRLSDTTSPGNLELMSNFWRQTVVNELPEAMLNTCRIDEISYAVTEDDTVMTDEHNQQPLTAYQLIVFQGKFKPVLNDISLISWYAKQHGIALINSSYADYRATGKVPQMFQLRALNLPLPPSISASAAYLPSLAARHFEYPVIIKDAHGSHGHDNHLVHNEAELQTVLEGRPDLQFMVQAYIPNDCDYRILFIGNQQPLIIKRQANDGSHLNNTSQGGSAELIDAKDFSTEIVVQARQFAQFCHYEIAGVDVIIDSQSGEHYFLEINSQPQLATGAFVAKKAALVSKMLVDILAA